MVRLGRIHAFVLLATMASPGMALAAAISLSQPIVGTNYNVGAPITYTGQGSWDKSTEGTTVGVSVNLLWYDPANPDPLAPPTVVDSDTPSVSYSRNPETGNLTGFYSFRNSVDPNTQKSNLIALQDTGGHTTVYYVEAIPYQATGFYYIPNSNPRAIVRDTNKIGTIS